MCGIAGIYGFKGGADRLRDCLGLMNGAMVHRGPDEEGIYVSERFRSGIAARRLSIMDLEHGHQPMFNEDRSIAVVCNGEIYNHRELRRELERKGYRLRSHSDSEVLAHLYQEEGAEFLQRLNGMFALAVFDSRNGRMLLARDPVGMKHLYWGKTANGIVFASEARALFAAGLVTPRPNWDALAQFFSFGWIQSPQTAFQGLSRLKPGTHLLIDGEDVTEVRYWAPEFQQPEPGRDLESYADELQGLLVRAVVTHLDADVPAGLFLSGGWDSSLISLYASRNSAGPLNTYSLAFPDDPGSDESRYSRSMAKQIGSIHREIEIRNEDVVEALSETVLALEEPVVSSPTTLDHLLSRVAGRDLKLVLGGEGADELFAGYTRFGISPLHRLRRMTPSPIWPATLPLPLNSKWARALRFLSSPDEELAHNQLISSLIPHQLTPLFRHGPSRWPVHDRECIGIVPETRNSFRDDLDLKLSVEFTGRLADGILFIHDKNSMHHSLEIRMPFLDLDVVRFAHRLPSEFKSLGSERKRVLGPLARELPGEIASRTKQGLHTPPSVYRRDSTVSFYAETILETSLSSGIFNQQKLESWVADGVRGVKPGSYQLWPVCHFCLWWNHFIEAGAPDSRALGEAA